MMQSVTFALSIFLVVLMVMVNESNAAGNGCEWSGCVHFSGARCATGVTGASGRPILKFSSKCQLFGRRDFCCDDDCRHQDKENCGRTCDELGMKSYTHEFEDITCLRTIPRFGTRRGKAQFCCP